MPFCPKCGQPYELVPGATQGFCEFCGNALRLAAPTKSAEALSSPTSQTPAPTARAKNPRSSKTRKRVLAVAAVVIFLFAALVSYGAYLNLSSLGGQSTTQPLTTRGSTTVTNPSTTTQPSTTTSGQKSTTTIHSSPSSVSTSINHSSAASTTSQPTSLSIADSTLAEGVDSNYQPVNRTQVFDTNARFAYSWINLANVYSPSHNVTWVWLTSWGQVYFRYQATIPDPGNGRHYPNWYTYCDIYIKGSNAIYLAGSWQVGVYIDGALDLVQNFTLQSPYVTPQGIRSAYDVAPLIQSGYTGKGVTVAIINSGIDNTFYSDIKGFDAAYGLPNANITVVEPNGSQGTNVEEPQGETTADVEFVHAMAPDAHILLVLVGGLSGFFTGFSYVIDNNAADIATVSPSWAWWGQGNQGTVLAENSEFAKGAGQNITLIAASNDWGSNNTVPWGSITGDFWTAHLPYSWLMPQYSQYFTAVGGTALTLIGSRYGSEAGWNQSGGGPSNLFSRPSWQTGPGVPNNNFRVIPDLSLDASCSTGYTFFWNGHLGYFCGTSGGAPTFAGIVADIVQAAGKRVGLLNPMLYSLASSAPSTFHDVTGGCSLVKTGSVIGTGYCSSAGWDYVTGLGSPDAVKLLGGIAHVQLAQVTNMPTGSELRLGALVAISRGVLYLPYLIAVVVSILSLTLSQRRREWRSGPDQS
ncbi:MAG: hypothetical protein OK422_06095 [Thaumarchaeota archaeon]|nr:hypothetical protein [Nitrososphaerota archaeon]